MNDPLKGFVTFVEYDLPPLEAGGYEIALSQSVQIEGKEVSPPVAGVSIRFAVSGERFSIDPAEIDSVFPQDLANGEFEKVLPHVIFNRRTLPWERSSVPGVENSPWLAVLLFNDDEVPNVQKLTAKDLVSNTELISVYDATGARTQTTTKGTLPDHTVSYPGFNHLDYGEAVDTPCTAIDIPADIFNRIAPSALDLPYLAHYREVDTANSVDNTQETLQNSIVVSNRVSKANASSHAFLVSIEEMGNYLPSKDKPNNLPEGTLFVRLIVYRTWKFFANSQDETLQTLLENLVPQAGEEGVSSLQLPFDGPTPSDAEVTAARMKQASGTLKEDDAQVLLFNALTMGYVPLPHHLRHGGETASWYRGPLVPYPVATTLPSLPISGPDALLQYNPQTGLFDASYSSAWQLGQLLALQNQNFATSLYNWKKSVQASDAIAEEEALINAKLLGTPLLESVFSKRQARLFTPPIPEEVVDWIAKLRLLSGVPFNYLVPDEKMLPPESLRFFYLDFNWVDALVDGAFSIGRTTTGEAAKDAKWMNALKTASFQRMKQLRKNRRPSGLKETSGDPIISGFLIRSKAVSGWPGLNVFGYSDMDSPPEAIMIYKLVRLSDDILICFLRGIWSNLIFMSLQYSFTLVLKGCQVSSQQVYALLNLIKLSNQGSSFLPLLRMF